jgi:hypothetical protein
MIVLQSSKRKEGRPLVKEDHWYFRLNFQNPRGAGYQVEIWP